MAGTSKVSPESRARATLPDRKMNVTIKISKPSKFWYDYRDRKRVSNTRVTVRHTLQQLPSAALHLC